MELICSHWSSFEVKGTSEACAYALYSFLIWILKLISLAFCLLHALQTKQKWFNISFKMKAYRASYLATITQFFNIQQSAQRKVGYVA